MRTTVDIDSDVLERLRREAQRAKIPFTRLVNRVLQRGLAERAGALPSLDEVLPARALQVREGINLDSALRLADMIEDEELLQKRARRKSLVRLLDANILLYATDKTSVHHGAVRRRLDALLQGDMTVGIPHVAVLALLRLITSRRVFAKPLRPDEALATMDALLSHPRVALVAPGERHWAILRELLAETGAAGNLTTDAHIAALALERGATVVTTDADFTRFAGLRVENPTR